MAISDERIIEASEKIMNALAVRSMGMEPLDKIQYVYNEAIDDVSNFINDLVKQNPGNSMILRALSRDIRRLLTLRLE